jgi:hypothetical protein
VDFDIKLTEHKQLTHGLINNAGTNIYFSLLLWNIGGAIFLDVLTLKTHK